MMVDGLMERAPKNRRLVAVRMAMQDPKLTTDRKLMLATVVSQGVYMAASWKRSADFVKLRALITTPWCFWTRR